MYKTKKSKSNLCYVEIEFIGRQFRMQILLSSLAFKHLSVYGIILFIIQKVIEGGL